MSVARFAVKNDVVTGSILGGVPGRSWRVEIVFAGLTAPVGGYIVLDDCGLRYMVHDLRGLRHIDGAPIADTKDHVHCETEGCERLPSGMCGRFGE